MDSRSTTLVVFVVACAAAFAVSLASADPIAPQSLTTISTSTRNLSSGPAQSVGAQGGNVTQVNINALTITASWQGYFGQIQGEITLDDASSNTFYNWSMTKVAGQVYATRNSTITWNNVNCTSASQLNEEQTYLGQVASDGDSVANTFTQVTHPVFSVTPSRTIVANTCNSTNLFVSNQSQSANWTEVLLHDNASIVYAAVINDSVVGFNGQQYDFQIMVGENEKTGNIGSTPYYFWLQLV